jgi:ABC-type sugar transport system ATPase subunit
MNTSAHVLAAPVRAVPTAEPVADATLTCRGLRKRYGDLVAVDDVSFDIGPGETYGLLGSRGS